MRDAQFSRPVFGTVNRHSRSNDEQGYRGPNGATELCPKIEIKIPVTVVMQGCTGIKLDRHQHEIQIPIPDTEESHGLIGINHGYDRHGPGPGTSTTMSQSQYVNAEKEGERKETLARVEQGPI